jgi:hypothetical protein
MLEKEVSYKIENFKKYMKEIPTAVWGVASELIFAGISNDAES